MLAEQAETLRMAVENLINAKLQDILTYRNALDRLIAHRSNWVSSPDVRNAERHLEQVFAQLLSASKGRSSGTRGPARAPASVATFATAERQ
jgi:hypothetical protein